MPPRPVCSRMEIQGEGGIHTADTCTSSTSRRGGLRKGHSRLQRKGTAACPSVSFFTNMRKQNSRSTKARPSEHAAVVVVVVVGWFGRARAKARLLPRPYPIRMIRACYSRHDRGLD